MMNSSDINGKTLPIADCPGQVQVPTPKELVSLDAMREIKERVRELKKQRHVPAYSGTAEDSARISALETEMAQLKKDWHMLEEQWRADVKERMIYLGHETGGDR